MLISWMTLAHLGLGSLVEVDNFGQWQGAEQKIKPVMKAKMYMNYIKAVSSGGSGGTLIFSDRPKFKHLLQHPRWDWNSTSELEQIEDAMTEWIDKEETETETDDKAPVMPPERQAKIKEILETPRKHPEKPKKQYDY